jgi:type II secretory pathway component PulF
MSHSEQYLFTEQLANLVGAGITLDEALGILVRRMKQPSLHSLSQNLHRALVDGRSLSQALRDYPRIFSPLYINMVAAGEASGALADILKRLVRHLSDVKGLRDRVQQALLYPALLVVIGILLVIVFMTQMVPKLLAFFTDTHQALPPSTQMIINIDQLVVGYWWLGVAAIFGLAGLFKVFTRSTEGRKAWDAFIWRFPLISLVIRYRYFAQFARTLGTLVENGVTLLRALELLEEISGNEFVRLKMVQVRKAVVDGATLSTALAEQNLFPELFTDMMSVGEQTGRFGQSMGNIAEIYERELDKQVQIISTLVPPLVMVAIASIVGFLVYGIMTAVFSMTKGLNTTAH